MVDQKTTKTASAKAGTTRKARQASGTDAIKIDEAAESGRSRVLQHAISQVCRFALRATEVEDLLDRTAEIVADAARVDSVGIFELTDDKKVLRLSASLGWSVDPDQLRAIPAAVCRPLYQALSSEGAVRFERPEFNILPLTDDDGGRGLALAIGERSKRAGVLTICSRDPDREFDDSEVDFLQTIAFILAAVWDRGRFEATLMLRNRALEALDQGVMITDARRLDNPLIYVNPAFERLTGYNVQNAIGKNPRFLQGRPGDPILAREMRQSIEAGHPYRDTILNYRRNGEEFWNDLSVSTVRDGENNITHHVGVISDVTERMQLEAQLHQAQKMEAIGHLTGGIAHDFNNLLAVILGNSEILLEDIDNDDLRELVELLMKAAERGAILTQRLLAFGRRQTLRPEPLEVNQAVQSLTQMLQRTLGEHIRLVTSDDECGRCALVDRAQFESAILNLAVNARDAMPDGGELGIMCAPVTAPSKGVPPELDDGEYLKVSVRDTGTGMSPEVLAQAFEPFFTTKDVGRGSGLGLAMVHGFVHQSGGHVGIDSEVGKGTTVNLFLPMAAENSVQEPVVGENEGPAIPEGSETILLVEDEKEVRRYVSRLLARLGYSVVEAEDAMSALKVLETVNKIDLLFSDLILPGGTNGLKLVEMAKEMRPELRILLTTGYTEEYERLSESSPALILRKPYKRKEIATLLRTVLDKTGTRRKVQPYKKKSGSRNAA